jgi:hypothetical protein
MPSKILYLEDDEEITSVIDRLKHIDETSIVLVIPRNAAITSSVVSLKLLKKSADDLGRELFLVASDDTSRTLIRRAGLVAHAKIDESFFAEHDEDTATEDPAESITTRPIPEPEEPKKPILSDISPKSKAQELPKKSDPTPNITVEPRETRPAPHQKNPNASRFKKWNILIIAIVLISLGSYLFFSLPNARVTITLASVPEAYSKDYTVAVKTDESSDDSVIVGQIIKSEQEQSLSAKPTGTKTVGEKATGTVTISNEYSTTPQTIIAGTTVQSAGGLTYKTNSQVTVPGYTDPGGGKVPGEASVAVTAAEIGTKYNIGPSNFTIPGLNSEIYADSSTAMSGGSSRQATVVAKTDISKLEIAIIKSLKEKLFIELEDQVLSAEQTLLDDAIEYETVSSKADKSVGDEAKQVTATVKLRATGLVYDTAELKDKVRADLEADLDDEHVLADKDLKDLVVTVKKLDISMATMNIDTEITALIAPAIDEKILKQNVAGRTVKEAEKYLESIKEVTDSSVRVWPDWWFKSVTVSINKIEVVTKYQVTEE